jgi:hypothetical protein
MTLPFRITVRCSDWQSRNSDTGETLVELCYAIYNFGVTYRLQRVCWYGRDRLDLLILSKKFGLLQYQNLRPYLHYVLLAKYLTDMKIA